MLSSSRFSALLASAFVALAGCHDATSPNSSRGNQSPALGSMNVGDVRVLTYAQSQTGLTIPDSLASAIYVIVVANVAGDWGSVSLLAATGDRMTATGTEPQPIPRGDLQSPALRPRYTRVGGALGETFEAGLREYERRHLQPRATLPVTAPAATASPPPRANRIPAGVVPAVGEQYTFNVPGKSADPCTDFDTVTATVRTVSNHAIILTDNRASNNGFTAGSYDSLAAEFDTYIYPTEVGYYGAPTDIDQNGHVYMLFTPSVNLLTPAGAADSLGFVGGYTFAGDFLPTTGNGGCAESNRGEIFYLRVPDPTGQFGNVFSPASVESNTRVTVAHEFQHAINTGNRITGGVATMLESTWLEEALSSLAEDNVGRVEAGFADLQRLSASTVMGMDTTIFETYFAQNFSRAQMYAMRPDTIGPVVPYDRVESDLAAFGAGWAFLRYTTDWFSNDDPRAFTRALAAGPDTGMVNLVGRAGVPIDTLFAHWLVTMYTDGRPIANLAAQYNYRTYALRDILSHMCANASCTARSYLPVTPIGDGRTALTIAVPSTSAAYFVTTKTTGGARTIRFTPAAGSFTDPATIRLYVIRVE